jgi:ribulose-phosphate 3-epimerase
MIQIIPAIIPHTKEQMIEEIKKVSSFAPVIQIDITDGVFVPTKTWPYNGRDTEFYTALTHEEEGLPEWENVEFEIHLMVKNPETVIQDWISAGAQTIIVHIEATDKMDECITLCRNAEVSIGIAIKPATDIEKIKNYVSQVDFIQCMGSDVLGKHGVALENTAIEKIKTLHTMYPDSIIGIDIGVTEENAETLYDAGATKLITGSALLDAPDPESTYMTLSRIS